MVNRSGTVGVLKVRLAGIVLVVRPTPGRIEPQGEPTPGKFAAALKLPVPPLGEPSRLVNGGAMRLPVSPKLGPGPPTNGNCTKGWLNAGRKTAPLMPLVPLTRSGASMMAGPLPRSVALEESCAFGREKT